MSRIFDGVRKSTMAAVVAITLVVAQSPALAQDDQGDFSFSGWEMSPGAAVLAVLLVLGEGYLLVGGSVVGVGNMVYASRGEQSTSGWRNQGYVLGALNVVIGGIIIGSGVNSNDDDMAIFGAVQAGVGLVDLGFTIWSQVQYDGSRRSVTVSPLVMPSRDGPPAMGVGVQLVGW